jgi:4'-phosphopantetheinyl transferase
MTIDWVVSAFLSRNVRVIDFPILIVPTWGNAESILSIGPGGDASPQERISVGIMIKTHTADGTMGKGQYEVQVAVEAIVDDPSRLWDLTPEEQQRAGKLKVDRVRRQFVYGRSELRRSLAKRLPCRPLDVPIVIRPDGKPILVGDPFHFNLAHSGDYVLIGIADSPVGVDMELVREIPNAADLLRRFFSHREASQFEGLPAEWKPAAFFRGWTCKEALLKADGRAMRISDRCTVDLDPRNPPAVLDFPDSPRPWALQSWEPKPGYVAAVAVAVG